jgi:organic hydroperoxide reductase OsmC/OhrA
MATVHRAEFEWVGGYSDGEGKLVSTSSGQVPELEMTTVARVDDDVDQATPEELLAAAYAADFAMQFTSGLVGFGWEPEEMQVSCEIASEIGLGITQATLTATVTVDGLTDEQIFDIAHRAKIMSPLSRALTGVDVALELPELILDDEDEDDEEAEVSAASEE